MAIVDKTVEVSVRGFFRELGIADQAALDALCILMCGEGEMRDIGSLERLRDLVLRGCFRNERPVRGALFDEYGHDVNADYCRQGIDALVALRIYTEVSTREAVVKYCGDVWDGYPDEVVNLLGERIPEWFFPALVILASQSDYNKSFQTKLNMVLMIWEMGGDPLGSDFRSLSQLFAAAWRTLSQYKLSDDEQWLIIYPEEEEPGETPYDEF